MNVLPKFRVIKCEIELMYQRASLIRKPMLINTRLHRKICESEKYKVKNAALP